MWISNHNKFDWTKLFVNSWHVTTVESNEVVRDQENIKNLWFTRSVLWAVQKAMLRQGVNLCVRFCHILWQAPGWQCSQKQLMSASLPLKENYKPCRFHCMAVQPLESGVWVNITSELAVNKIPVKLKAFLDSKLMKECCHLQEIHFSGNKAPCCFRDVPQWFRVEASIAKKRFQGGEKTLPHQPESGDGTGFSGCALYQETDSWRFLW